jgi:peptidoglycan/LPS O-acetylase OafA/YrhL
MSMSVAAAFNPRANSIGFVRWLMAFAVIFSHAGPLAGFYGGRDLGTQWSNEQSLGGVAVGGFFFLSGFLITKSKMGSASTPRYFWRRVMRIFPAWWATLLVTAFILGPIAWVREAGTINGYFTTPGDSPWTYFYSNFTLILRQVNIAGMGTSLPYYKEFGGLIWNGSAWTLAYEFGGYILIAILGIIGALTHRAVAGSVTIAIILLATVQWLGIGKLGTTIPLFGDFRVLLLMAPFAFGILFALYADKIPLDWRLAAAGLVIALYTYATGGYLVVGQYAFAYFLMWFALSAKAFNRWERYGDFSYGIYIIAWPLMQFAAYFQLERFGWLVYHVVIVVGCHIYAFLSWHLLEKPAMGLKNWTPRWLEFINRKLDPVWASARAMGVRIAARLGFS